MHLMVTCCCRQTAQGLCWHLECPRPGLSATQALLPIQQVQPLCLMNNGTLQKSMSIMKFSKDRVSSGASLLHTDSTVPIHSWLPSTHHSCCILILYNHLMHHHYCIALVHSPLVHVCTSLAQNCCIVGSTPAFMHCQVCMSHATFIISAHSTGATPL